MITPVSPPNGIGFKLNCPHACENVFMPGDDKTRFELTYRSQISLMEWFTNMGVGQCPIDKRLYYINTSWTNL